MDNVTWIPIFAYLGAIGLLTLGIFAMVFYHDLIRMVLGLLLLESGVNLFLVTVGYRPYADAPILVDPALTNLHTIGMVDPVPQALVLTAIVIGVGVQALALALIIKIYRAFGTLDVRQIAKKIAAVPETSGDSPASFQTDTNLTLQSKMINEGETA